MENLTPVRGEQISVGGRAKSNQIMDNLYIQFPVEFQESQDKEEEAVLRLRRKLADVSFTSAAWLKLIYHHKLERSGVEVRG